MANTTPSKNLAHDTGLKTTPAPGTSPRENIREGADLRGAIHDASERFANGELGSRARDVWDDATEMAGELYSRAGHYFQGNSAKIVGAVAVVAAAGLFGYYLGKTARYPMPELREL